jgi:plastocyanin
MPHRTRRWAVVGILGASALGFGALAVTATAAKTATLKLSADPSGAFRFNVTKLTVSKPGKVTMVMRNPSPLPHDIAVKGKGIKTTVGKIVGMGGTSRITVTLKKGTYTFYCSVGGHAAAGMKGTLVVK